MGNKRTKAKTLFVSLLISLLILPIPFRAEAASDSWNYKANTFQDVENGTFDDIIWDDENRRIQLQGKTLHEDFSMYDDIDDMPSQGWAFSSSLNDSSSTAKIVQRNGKNQLYLERRGYYTNNLWSDRSFSPTRSGQVEFDITPMSGKTRVALNHHPVITLEKGNESSQFMFRFESDDNGNNQIRFGTNRGGAVKGKEYEILKDAFIPGETYRVKMVWDLNNGKGVSVYLNGKEVVSNFYQSMVTEDFYFHSVSLSAGEGGYPLEGTPGQAYYSFVSLEQSFNLKGTYTSNPISLNITKPSVLTKNASITWGDSILSGTTLNVQTRVSKNSGKTWSGWSTVKKGSSIPGLSKFDSIGNNVLIQYRVNMTANKNNITPWLKNLNISMELDRTLPTATISSSDTQWTNKPIQLTIKALDNMGVDYIVLPNGTLVKSSEATYTVSESKIYSFRVVDIGGNEKGFSFKVSNIDLKTPKLAVEAKSKSNQRQDIELIYGDE